MLIHNKTQQSTLSTNAALAKNFFERARGLLGRNELASGEALIIPKCPAIHMFFMKFPIDVVFADKKHKVVGLVKNIKPFYITAYFFRAYFAIELKTGTIDVAGIKIGDELIFEAN